jgi:hypothetical protein
VNLNVPMAISNQFGIHAEATAMVTPLTNLDPETTSVERTGVMKMCKVNIRSVLALALMVLAATSLALAQNQLRVNFLGVTSLQSEVRPNGVAGDDLTVKPSHPGHAAADVRPGLKALASAAPTSAPASIPTPNPQRVVSPDGGVFGFPGLDHFDQRFAGTGTYANTQLSLEPPDQGLCVGHGFVVETVNDILAVYSQSGTLLSGPVPLSQFWGLHPAVIRGNLIVYGEFTSDPRCYFDPASRRWFVTETEFGRDPKTGAFTSPSSILIAVSETSDPTGTYFLFTFDTTDGDGSDPLHPNCPCFGDQPLIGADANGFYVSTNEYPINGPGFNGAQVYALPKAGLVAGNLGSAIHFNVGRTMAVPPPDQVNGGIWYSVHPATAPGSEGEGSGTEYFLSSLQFGPAPYDNRIAVWALTNTQSLNRESPHLQLLHTVISSESYGIDASNPKFSASQKPGSTPFRDLLNASFNEGDVLNELTADDVRMHQVTYANGKLWGSLNTSVSADTGTLIGIAWFSVTPSLEDGHLHATIDHQGYVSVDEQNVMYPAIGVNRDGNAVMTFTLVGPDYWPSAAYAPIGNQAGEIRVAGAGVGPDDGFTGYAHYSGSGVARWGDYSAAAVDEEGDIWIATEYIGQSCTDVQFLADFTCGQTRSQLANWGTFIARVPAPSN